MDFIEIRCFQAVAKHLSFTKAAEELNLSQSSVSKRIAALENELNIKLFVRTKQYVYLTVAGKLLYREFEDITKKIESALESARNAGQGIIGELHIGFHGLLDINRILPDFFPSFSEIYPDIKLIIESYNFRELRDSLLGKTLDLIFTFSFEQQGNPNISRLLLNRSNTRVYYSRSLLENPGDSVPEFGDFKNKTLILLQENESPDTNKFVRGIYDRYGFPFPKSITVNTMETMLFYLESGLGIALLGSSYRLSFSDKIASIELEEKDSRVGTDALWLKENANPSLPLFTDALATHYRHISNAKSKFA